MYHPLTTDRSIINTLPFTELPDADSYRPQRQPGVSKLRALLEPGVTLDALAVHKESDVLIACFHGALKRSETVIPRFEWLRTFIDQPYSTIYFADPALHLHPNLALAWYTGWASLDLFPLMAKWVSDTAKAIDAKDIIFFGSSGGGFAALQVSSLVDNSLAIALNPQTSISKYRPSQSLSPIRSYIQHVMPELLPPGGAKAIDATIDLESSLGPRSSVTLRYEKPFSNSVFYVQNINDREHLDDHCIPFRNAMKGHPNSDRIRFYEYEGPHGHAVPNKVTLGNAWAEALKWRRSLQSTK